MKTYTITQKMINEKPTYTLPGVSGPGEYTYSENRNRYSLVASQQIAHDFDKGFGIGGLGRYEETPSVPTVAQIERMERIEARYTIADCGHRVGPGTAMSASLGTCCPDCYDRMSDSF